MSDATGSDVVQSRIYGIGAATGMCDEILDLGDLHPSSHGALRLRVSERDGVVESAEALPGLLHRGAEKLFEARDYRSVLMLANRHDWLAAFCSEVGAALVVEELIGLEVPERATWLRTLLAELTRASAALMFLGTSGPGAVGSAATMHRDLLLVRDRLLDVIEVYAGGRVHPMATRIGGLAQEPPADWLGRVDEICAEGARTLSAWCEDHLPHLLDRARGLAPLRPDTAIELAASGPVGRASGLDLDLRRDAPYLAYDRLDVAVAVRSEADAAARFALLAHDAQEALRLVRECAGVARELTGPVQVRLPKVLRAPEGRTYGWTENPTGINGYLLVSTGEPSPWRLKIRTASFAHVQAMAAALPGTAVTDLPLAVASFFFVAGDVDR